MDSRPSDTVSEEAAAAWDPEVAAMVGPGLAEAERDMGRVLSPHERLIFLRGYTYRCKQEHDEIKATQL